MRKWADTDSNFYNYVIFSFERRGIKIEFHLYVLRKASPHDIATFYYRQVIFLHSIFISRLKWAKSTRKYKQPYSNLSEKKVNRTGVKKRWQSSFWHTKNVNKKINKNNKQPKKTLQCRWLGGWKWVERIN